MKKIYQILKERSSRIGRKSIKGKVIFFVMGLAGTIWFLVRVIPKPSRASYPCMQAIAPTMSAFVLYLLSLVGGVKAWQKFKESRKHRHLGKASLAFIALCLCATMFYLNNPDLSIANGLLKTDVKQCFAPNESVGEAKGIYPGRVVWSHAPNTVSWDSKEGFWFEDRFVDQENCDKLLKNNLLSLTDEKKEKKAWSALFIYFNEKHGKGTVAYQKGEKIAVKINQNNTYSHADCEELNASPQLVLSLIRSLVEDAGVPQECITITDPSRFVTDYLYNKCHSAYPNVVFVDNQGGDGRVKSEYVENAIPFSKDNGPLAQGLSTSFVNADYVINMALLKGHEGQGVTLCGKNWYGTTSIHSDWRKNHHNNFNQGNDGIYKYLVFIDFMGHKDLGGKTMLYLIDGLYGSKNVNGAPSGKWEMQPFNGDWPNSLLASQDPVAIDAVALDFLISEFPDMRDVNYSDMYLIEAAMANNPKSKTVYDPERDGSTLSSLGVFEHWNNADTKAYSRNLEKSEGIELLSVEIPVNKK